jgi:ubiquinone biosynthesis protein
MARCSALLFEVTEIFDMETRTELVLLQKTMVVVEGVARALDPHSTCGRRPSPWCATGSSAISARLALVSLARQAPELAARAERLSREIDAMAEKGLRFDDETAEAIGKRGGAPHALRPHRAVGDRG